MTKLDWLNSSLALLSKKGIDILKIDLLCKELKLTKGSFYHHYTNYDTFINELLEYWYETYTMQILNEIQNYEDNVLKQIEIINDMIYSKDLNIEVQFRLLGFRNSYVQKYVEKIDIQRLEVIKNIQVKMIPKSSEEEIDLMASCIYSQFIGSLFVLPKIPKEKLKKMDDIFLNLFLEVNY